MKKRCFFNNHTSIKVKFVLCAGNALLFWSLLSTGCQDTHNRSYISYPNGWAADNKAIFQFDNKSLAPNKPYNSFIYLRNNNDYLFSNIFLIASIHSGGRLLVCDTLEYAMAANDGTWLGKGLLTLKESKLWWLENYTFSGTSTYTVEIGHALRYGRQAKIIDTLHGITDIAVSFEQAILKDE